VRACSPQQPLTSPLWIGEDWTPENSAAAAVHRAQLEQSDIITFHDYSWPEKFELRLRQLQRHGRPVVCTEYMARGLGSTFDGALPIGKREGVGMLNWGFVDGKTQTKFPWDSWRRPYIQDAPALWFHDVLHTDGTPYREREVELLSEFAYRPAAHPVRRDVPLVQAAAALPMLSPHDLT
jgi:hypothetical protein